MINHSEFSFIVRAPNDIAQCQHLGCKRKGDWSVAAIDDHDKTMLEYDNICEQHIFQAFIDAACGNF